MHLTKRAKFLRGRTVVKFDRSDGLPRIIPVDVLTGGSIHFQIRGEEKRGKKRTGKNVAAEECTPPR